MTTDNNDFKRRLVELANAGERKGQIDDEALREFCSAWDTFAFAAETAMRNAEEAFRDHRISLEFKSFGDRRELHARSNHQEFSLVVSPDLLRKVVNITSSFPGANQELRADYLTEKRAENEVLRFLERLTGAKSA